jgi:hypothetical protein
MKGERGVMARWSSECRLWAVAFVALSCSGCDSYAFALCENCPELFASTPIAQQTALPQQRAQSTRPYDRYVSRRWHQRRDDSRPLSRARHTPLTAFAAVTLERGLIGASVSGTVADPTPLEVDATTPATPALRIDELFNIMAAGPSDQPEEVAALRASMLGEFRMRQPSPGPDDRTGFLVPTLIAFGGGLLLIGAVLVSARRPAFTPSRTPVWLRDRIMLPSDRARRRRTNGTSLEGPTVSSGVRERLPNQAGATPAGRRSRSAMVNRHFSRRVG